MGERPFKLSWRIIGPVGVNIVGPDSDQLESDETENDRSETDLEGEDALSEGENTTDPDEKKDKNESS